MDPTNTINTILQLFAELASPDERRAEDGYYMLKDFLSKQGNSKYIVSKEVVPFLHVGLQHHDPLIRSLTLEQLALNVSKVDNAISIMKDNNLIVPIAKILGDDYSVAKQGEKFFLALARHPEGSALIFDPVVESIFEQHMKNETMQLRVMDLFSDISQISEELFTLSQPKFLDPIVRAFHTTSDVLRRLNFVEIIAKISKTKWGLQFINNAGLLQTYYNTLNDYITDKNSPASSISRSDSFLANKLISFIGEAADNATGVSYILQLPFLDLLARFLEEFSTRPANYYRENTEAAHTAISIIAASTPSGLTALINHSRALQAFTDSSLVEDPLIAPCAFHSFGLLFSSGQDSSVLESIFKKLPSPFMPYVMKCVNKPFEDMRYAVYHFMQGLAHNQWGVVVLLTHPGFFEWLTNRITENTKPGKEWKFSIVQRIVQHKEVVQSTLGGDKVADLQMYINRGIFFLPTEAALEVATKA